MQVGLLPKTADWELQKNNWYLGNCQ